MIMAMLLAACVQQPLIFVDSPLDGGVYDEGTPITVRVRVGDHVPEDIFLLVNGERAARWEQAEGSRVCLHSLGTPPPDDYSLLVEVHHNDEVHYETVEFVVQVPPPEPDTPPTDEATGSTADSSDSTDTGGGSASTGG